MKNLSLLLALLKVCFPFNVRGAFLGIPGKVASENGYDAGGTEPVCWLGRSMYGTLYKNIFEWSESTSRIENPLISDFEMVGEPELNPKCPIGTNLNVYPPQGDIRENRSLLTLRNYSFIVNGTLDLRQWPADIPVTDQDSMEAVVHVVLCELRSSGFCSPFVHFPTDGTDDVSFGDLHEGNHIDSEFIRIPIKRAELQNFHVDVQVRVNKPGICSVLAEIVFFLSNDAFYPNPLYMGSVTNIPLDESQVMEFRNEPEILETSQRAEIASYILIGLSGSIMLFMLFQICKHRKNQVLKLAQGRFLIAMLCSGLVGMVGSIFFNPKNDLYCNMLGPMLVVPVHLFYSIILGRLWRIHAVISPLLLLTLEREHSFSTKMVNFLNRVTTCTCKRRKRLRRKVSDAQLARVVALWALPQIILQIFRWTMTPNEVMVIFNEDLSKGTPFCDGIYQNQATEVLSGVLLVVQFIMMWVLAQQSQDLPSLFNEASAIFDVTLVSVVILAVATLVIIMTRGATMGPNVQYTIGVLAGLAMLLNTSLKLVLPKLRMVWRGETIVVTKLIADHNRERREAQNKKNTESKVHKGTMESKYNLSREDDDVSSDASSIVFVSSTPELMEFFDDEEEGGLESMAENSLAEGQLARTTAELEDRKSGDTCAGGKTARQRPTLSTAVRRAKLTNHSFKQSRRTIISRQNSRSRERVTATNAEPRRFGMFAAAFGSVRSLPTDMIGLGRPHSAQRFKVDYNPKVKDNKVVISETEPPTRRLLLRMIDAQRLLTQVNRTVLAGSTVPKEDWEQIRTLSVDLGLVFQEDVEFRWESNDNDSDSLRRRPPPASSSQQRTRLTLGSPWLGSSWHSS